MALTNAIVAPRYGAALFELTAADGTTQEVQTELHALDQVFNENPGLMDALIGPELKLNVKQDIVGELTTGALPVVARLVQMAFNYGRIAALPAIVADFDERISADAGQITGTATTAVPLSAAQTERLAAAVAHRLGVAHAELNNVVDANVIGGVRVQAANYVIDGTVQHRIDQIRATLLTH
ncbi:ATP synthase F1 subunit delta [Lacticaseibacillus thailandensis]|uniref:ATP synthase subunit delta n=1 Tax=Lacticaseibacillus thailandensis DSM 22698 = JCM 13996 TaxID=1423810 RepID=A0A0R2C8H0_9LACO|nr:ATP synthase F1 subunit delta [Lacticaseibacillus thailandensis]KRM87863.1 hypothetical protein FD19_GL000140 [Lacticaseibacillus thailandensis DSM 22698 = JCM 13996]